MKNTSNHFVILGLAIVVMSSSGVLGTLITLDPPVTIWIRCVIGSLALFIFQKIMGGNVFIGWGRDFKIVGASSMFLALHWTSYFYALSVSSIAVSMLSLFTYPVLTAILEPIIRKKKFKLSDILLALLAFVGVYFLIPDFDISSGDTLGVIFGLVSSLCYSFRNILLSYTISEHSGITLMYYQLLIISAVMWPTLFVFGFEVSLNTMLNEWDVILMLGLITTAFSHTLFVVSFKYFSVTTVSIISNLTPVCGIGLGFIFLSQIPDGNVYIGGSIIVLSAMIESVKAVKSS